jgi:hypothetical protein
MLLILSGSHESLHGALWFLLTGCGFARTAKSEASALIRSIRVKSEASAFNFLFLMPIVRFGPEPETCIKAFDQ